MNVVNFEINGIKYQSIPITGRNVLILNQKVINVVSKMVLSGSKSDKLSKVAIGLDALANAIGSLEDDEYCSLVERSLQNVTMLGVDATAKDVRLSDIDTIGNAFAKHPMDIYQVLFKVWEVNKLGPFDSESTGSSTEITGSQED